MLFLPLLKFLCGEVGEWLKPHAWNAKTSVFRLSVTHYKFINFNNLDVVFSLFFMWSLMAVFRAYVP